MATSALSASSARGSSCLAVIAMRASTIASRLRSVTGMTPSPFSSMMPKRAGNFASGGYSSVRTASGKRFWLTSLRPASSVTATGISIVNCARSGNGPGKLTSSTKSAALRASGSVAAMVLPPAGLSTTCAACSRETGAVKDSRIGRIGRQPASLLARSQEKRTWKTSRTLNVTLWS